MRNVRQREVTKSHITQKLAESEMNLSGQSPDLPSQPLYCIALTPIWINLWRFCCLYITNSIEVQCLGIIPSQNMIVWPCTSDFINYFHFFICFSVIRMKCIYKTYRMNVSYKHCVTTFLSEYLSHQSNSILIFSSLCSYCGICIYDS